MTSQIRLRMDERPGGIVAYVELANEAKRNAIGPVMIAELKSTFLELAENDALRAVVLSGAGDKAFAAGADLGALGLLDPASARQYITNLHEAIAATRALPVPVIAMIRGYCFGAAVELAAACDFRLGDTSTVIGMPEVKIGLPSVIDAILLPRLIGDGMAREMMLTGMNYDAEAAHKMRYLDHLCDPEDLAGAVEHRVDHIMQSAPLAVRMQRRLMNAWEQMSQDDGIALSIDLFEEAYRSGEPQRYIAAVRNSAPKK